MSHETGWVSPRAGSEAIDRPPGTIGARDRLLKELAVLDEETSALASELAPFLRPCDDAKTQPTDVDPTLRPKRTTGSDFQLSLVEVCDRLQKTSRLVADIRVRLDL